MALATRTRFRGRQLTIMAFAFGGVAVWLYPLVCGIAGMMLGLGAALRGDRLGRWATAAAAAGLVLGLFLSTMPASFMS